MKLNQAIKMLGLAGLLAVTTSTLVAQENADRSRRQRGGENADQQGGPGGGRGGFGNMSPEERTKFFADRIKEQLEITDEAEWKALEPLVTKVTDARFATMAGGRGFGGRGGRGGAGGGAGGPGGTAAVANSTAEALQKAIDAKASNSETKAALDKFVAARKAKQAELEKAQANLRKVLTPRQEAIATLNGLL